MKICVMRSGQAISIKICTCGNQEMQISSIAENKEAGENICNERKCRITNTKKLNSIQHRILVNSLSAYRTISMNCACFLTQIVPIQNSIELQISKFEIKHKCIPAKNTLIHTYNSLIHPDPHVKLKLAIAQHLENTSFHSQQ